MAIRLTSGAHATLRAEAAQAHPHECCGLLLGPHAGLVDTVRPAENRADSPADSFLIDPAILFDAFKAQRSGGAQVIGYYHSHPNGNPAPSQRDLADAPHDGLIWAIIAMDEIHCWRDAGPQGFEALGRPTIEYACK